MTKELEQAARGIHICDSCGNAQEELVKFALAQLREQLAELERRGYAGHKKGCNSQNIWEPKGPCSCGWDEMKRELEEK